MSGRRRYCEADDNLFLTSKLLDASYALKIAKKVQFAADKKFVYIMQSTYFDIFCMFSENSHVLLSHIWYLKEETKFENHDCCNFLWHLAL